MWEAERAKLGEMRSVGSLLCKVYQDTWQGDAQRGLEFLGGITLARFKLDNGFILQRPNLVTMQQDIMGIKQELHAVKDEVKQLGTSLVTLLNQMLANQVPVPHDHAMDLQATTPRSPPGTPRPSKPLPQPLPHSPSRAYYHRSLPGPRCPRPRKSLPHQPLPHQPLPHQLLPHCPCRSHHLRLRCLPGPCSLSKPPLPHHKKPQPQQVLQLTRSNREVGQVPLPKLVPVECSLQREMNYSTLELFSWLS